MSQIIDTLVENLKKRNINAYKVASKEEALQLALRFVPDGTLVGFGGSVTLEQIGLLDELRKIESIYVLDRTKASSPIESREISRKCLLSDVFFSGCNAITSEGQLVNVDGIGNRVAALNFGPRRVVIIAGKNKIVDNIDAAMERVRKVAMPLNIERLKGKGWDVENMWGQVSIIERQRDNERLHVILVDDNLGF
jgi:L-lactate utilization protein LutB